MNIPTLHIQVGLVALAVLCACKTTDTSKPIQGGRRLLSTNVTNDLPSVTIPLARKESLTALGVASLPPEANGVYVLGCEDKNTSINLSLVNSPGLMQLADIPPNTKYAANVFLKIDGNSFGISIALFLNASCQQSNTQNLSNLDERSFVFLCSKSAGSDDCLSTSTVVKSISAKETAILNKLHFCRFSNWQTEVIYEINDKVCVQSVREDYSDGSFTTENRSITGNSKGGKLLSGKFIWNATNSTLSFTPTGQSKENVLKKTEDSRAFAILDELKLLP